uniref:F-box domain-containing protein n=1 Tax=Mycena chlorophos TaxID=658473 RepID=A0ABQ0KW03_MYCCL|nr:predicted protein [Mycena chlorophos]
MITIPSLPPALISTLAMLSASGEQLRTRLAELQASIPALQADLASIIAEEAQIRAALDAIVYPVHTLPLDILALIFNEYIEAPHIGGARYVTTPSRGPLALCSVCRGWRDVCLSLPTLWAVVDVYPRRNYRSEDEFAGLVELLERWITRSGTCVVDLRIGTCSRQDLMDRIFFTLAKHAKRIRMLELLLQRIFKFPDERLYERLPALEKFKMSTTVSSYAETTPDKPIWSGFGVAPNLREAVLDGVFLQQIALPWGQLTSLSLAGITLIGCLEILSLTPQLESLSAALRTNNYLFHGPLSPSAGLPLLTLPLLHTFTVAFSEEGGLLEQLMLPALQKLYIIGMNTIAPPSPVLARLMSLAERSQWPLTTVGFAVTWPSNVAECLAALQNASNNIRKVSVELRSNHTGMHLQPLLRGLAVPESVPSLRQLVLENCPVDIPVQLVRGIVDAHGERLASLELSLAPPPPPTNDDHGHGKRVKEVASQLKQVVRREGLDLLVSVVEY